MKYYAIIPAAGSGDRFGGNIKKQFLEINGKSILDWTLDAFIKTNLFDGIVVCLPEIFLNSITQRKNISYIQGGASRAESVFKGFQFFNPDDDDFVLIHDAVRPLVSCELIEKVARTVKEKKAVVAGLQVTDTIKLVKDHLVEKTIDRSKLIAAQTPQGFSCELLNRVYKQNADLSSVSTDEAMMIENFGEKVFIVEGEKSNFKITTPLDKILAEGILKKSW